MLDPDEIARLRAALTVTWERLLVELTITTAGVPLKRAQEILGHASERTTLAIYTHSMRRQHDDSADRIAALAGLAGNKRETSGDASSEETAASG